MELTGTLDDDLLPFSGVENECDMERRYQRITAMLEFIGADSQATLVVADNRTLYFAAQIERILPWPLAIVLADDSRPLETVVSDLRASCVIWATVQPLSVVPRGCQLVVTFNDQRMCPSQNTGISAQYDVLNTLLIPWLAISGDRCVYKTGDALDPETTLPQFYLERAKHGTLVVTSLSSVEEPTALPLIRYDTGIQISELHEHWFVIDAK